MKKIRIGAFETNSSSSHALLVNIRTAREGLASSGTSVDDEDIGWYAEYFGGQLADYRDEDGYIRFAWLGVWNEAYDLLDEGLEKFRYILGVMAGRIDSQEVGQLRRQLENAFYLRDTRGLNLVPRDGMSQEEADAKYREAWQNVMSTRKSITERPGDFLEHPIVKRFVDGVLERLDKLGFSFKGLKFGCVGRDGVEERNFHMMDSWTIAWAFDPDGTFTKNKRLKVPPEIKSGDRFVILLDHEVMEADPGYYVFNEYDGKYLPDEAKDDPVDVVFNPGILVNYYRNG